MSLDRPLFRDGHIIVAMESGAEIPFPVAANPRLARGNEGQLSKTISRSAPRRFRESSEQLVQTLVRRFSSLSDSLDDAMGDRDQENGDEGGGEHSVDDGGAHGAPRKSPSPGLRKLPFLPEAAHSTRMNSSVDRNHRVGMALLPLRVTVFVVMLIWTIDKFVRPAHAVSVYEHFYFVGGLGPAIIYIVGIVELIILVGFLLGIARGFTYGAVLVFHALSTLSPFRQYLHPFEGSNILFFAAWPMLGACFALFYLRDSDTLWTLGRRRTE